MAYPTNIDSFTLHNPGDLILNTDVNTLSTAVTAIENSLLNGFQYNLVPSLARAFNLGSSVFPWLFEYLRQGTVAATYSGSGIPSATTLPTGNYYIGDSYLNTANNTAFTCAASGSAGGSVWVQTAGVTGATTNVTIVQPNPFVSFQGTETGNIQTNIVEAGGDWWFLSNATYSSPNFSCVNTSLAANGWLLRLGGNWIKVTHVATGSTWTSGAWTALAAIDTSGNLTAVQGNFTGNVSVTGSLTSTGSLTAAGGTFTGNVVVNSPNTINAAGSLITNTIDYPAFGNHVLTFSAPASPVNYLEIDSAATGNSVVIKLAGSDANISASIQSKGIGAINFGSNSGLNNLFALAPVASAVNYLEIDSAATGVSPALKFKGSDTNVTGLIVSQGTGAITLQTPSAIIANFVPATSAVNYLEIDSAATGAGISLNARGTDTNIPFVINSKGTGNVTLNNGSNVLFNAAGGSSLVDYVQVNPSATGNPATVSVQAVGTDSNINLNLISKGTGTVQVNSVPFSSGWKNFAIFTSSGSFTPTSSSVMVLGWGPGGGAGGGGGVTGSPGHGGGGGAGGGAGGVGWGIVAVTVGTSVTVTVPNGGAGGSGGAAGSDGSPGTAGAAATLIQNASTIFSVAGGTAGGQGLQAGTGGSSGGNATAFTGKTLSQVGPGGAAGANQSTGIGGNGGNGGAWSYNPMSVFGAQEITQGSAGGGGTGTTVPGGNGGNATGTGNGGGGGGGSTNGTGAGGNGGNGSSGLIVVWY